MTKLYYFNHFEISNLLSTLPIEALVSIILDSSIFTGMFTDHYSHPDGLCFDIMCTDEPIIDNEELEGYNVDERVRGAPYIQLEMGVI